ncbi:GNAT family N-acetyltransferase [Pseudooceanicola aestuarii]|uniref:GNAT family N-acetyltransferase n=1 Tax=Pseudooceanicola aestuarii TaxID=2697319 RepID=UPI0013D76B6D|nr:GNAT family N-acetyltransferase [Pseudooceanicola aestuarii]
MTATAATASAPVTTVTIPTVTTPRLTLRAPGPQDVAAVAAFYASDRSAFVGGPKDADGAWRQLGTEIGHWTLRGYGRWMVEVTDTGETAGMVGLWNPVGWPEPEVGWDLFDGHTGRGYATEAAIAARDYAFATVGLPTLISLVAPGNDASAAVAARMGAAMDGEITHPTLGHLHIWRHPAPGSGEAAQ